MGVFQSMIKQALDSFSNKEHRIIMIGLDAAGKTSILYKLKNGESISTIPTIGFNVETIVYKKINMTVWDVGGQSKIRELWHHYFAGTTAIIFVVDAADNERFEEAKETLLGVLEDDRLDGVPLLVYANKADLVKISAAAVVLDGVCNGRMGNRKWYVQACCANTGEGLTEGLEWINETTK